MNKIISLLIIISIFFSCVKEEKNGAEIISRKESLIIADKLNLNRSFSFDDANVYYLDKKKNVRKKEIYALKIWYDSGHINNHKSLADYIYTIFNQRLGSNDSITIRSLVVCGKLDSTIYNLYRKKNIESIKERYCIYNSKSKDYIINKYVTASELETISYLFFINRYLKTESDQPLRITFYSFDSIFANPVKRSQ